ncbi:sulfite reductase flavoprotein subunit alpha [Mycobacterium sp. M26]|uniref:diflavin oxidoreductase n=1 Tax=Mycobacterium sp. M26 TaxID=1762962 RepID=UPI000A9D51CD|nr:sulfite reductase flavoprotein subunit alpha [Mycobacterium sp. M26]
MDDHPGFAPIIGYASDMGTAEYIAVQLSEHLTASGIDVGEVELNDISLGDLRSASHVIIVTSTFGDGEVPDNGVVFWEELSATVEQLPHLNYAVLALGDSSYELFCNAGRIIDARLAELGGSRLADRVELDCYREGDARQWLADMTTILEAAGAERAGTTPIVAAARPARPVTESIWTEDNPYVATIIVNRLLTGAASDKEVRHFELDLGDSGITYCAGDSVAIHAPNDSRLVEAILATLGVSGHDVPSGRDLSLAELLGNHLEIRTPSQALLTLVSSRSGAPPSALRGCDVLDLLGLGDFTLDEVLETLLPLRPRDYSIASSPLHHPDHLHLTVAAVRYARGGRQHHGTASTFLADRAATARIHLRPNHHFRLPAPDVPILMVGPGTGIAPFRAFLQERQSTRALGKSWLFFGDRRRHTDFLYGDDLEGFLASGALTRMDLAFSRDASQKVYVQHRMKEHAREFFDWLEDGAHLYVCGADTMAKDVDRTLHEIVADVAGVSAEAAHSYVNDLIKSHRYVRDVY